MFSLKKWVVSGGVLQVGSTGYADKLDENCEGNVKIKDYSSV